MPIDAPLWCFPEYQDRVRFDHVWGKFHVEVKESNDHGCSPNDNWFSKDLVSFNPRTKELTLEFAVVNGQWVGSEVRLYMDDLYQYGEFSFHVKSVAVLEKDVQVSDRLPADVVLGLFSLDNFFDAKEAPFGREIDIEISQWGEPDAADVQFLIQPSKVPGPHYPVENRFFSGGKHQTFEQGGHFYNFTWSPTSVAWSSDAGGGQLYTYSTQLARLACTEDFVQCLPHNVDIRLNLWGLGGTTRAPMFGNVVTDENNARVRVVVDYVGHVPSGITHMEDGQECSKDCQCSETSICKDGICVGLHIFV